MVEVLSQPYNGFTDAVYSAVNEGVGPTSSSTIPPRPPST